MFRTAANAISQNSTDSLSGLRSATFPSLSRGRAGGWSAPAPSDPDSGNGDETLTLDRALLSDQHDGTFTEYPTVPTLESLRPGGTVVIVGVTSGMNPPAAPGHVFCLQQRILGSVGCAGSELGYTGCRPVYIPKTVSYAGRASILMGGTVVTGVAMPVPASMSAPASDIPPDEAASVEPSQTAVDKALVLLKSLAELDGEIGVSELARRTRLTKSTAFRLLGILQRNDLVERVGSNYRLSSQLFDIGARVYGPTPWVLQERLMPYLADLYELTHETVHLATLHSTDIVYVNKLQGHRGTRSPSRIGARLPAYCTAVGKALLAFDHSAAEAAIAGGLMPRTENTCTDPDQLRAELQRIRQEGIAYDRQEAVPGLTCVAVPVMGSAGRPVAALSVSGAPRRFAPARFAPALRRVAYEAGRAMNAAAPLRQAPPSGLDGLPTA
ncbi:IclR family transcriptional regulator C-terminal domain-containing protein [Streptomyces sp. NPDC003247]|uniref:IclR family transcriptional regulator n=1 Tax=Streptomyces sp. NPDC003247 TaxID=3364677 RepID=UPI00368EA3F2